MYNTLKNNSIFMLNYIFKYVHTIKEIMNKYNNLLEHFDQNKDNKWSNWLSFDKYFNNQGKQGAVGLFKKKQVYKIGDIVIYVKKRLKAKIVNIDNETDSYHIQIEGDKAIIDTLESNIKHIDVNEKDENLRYVFKLSQYTNHLPYHEMTIMQGLKNICTYCPHFCKGFGVLKVPVEPRFRKTKNPFDIVSKYPIEKDILICEYIDSSSKFYNYIKSKNIHEDVLYSIVKQVLMGICIAQKEKEFTHYDLHSNNVMIKKCNKDLVFLYKLDNENKFCVPTLGYYSVIIDYGFSYISDMNDGPLYTSLCHTDVGFISDRFDWVADPKLFLVTVSDEIKEKRRTKKSKKLRRIVKNIFTPLRIDWESGWDDVEKKGAVDYVANILQNHNDISKLFDDYDYYCLDLLQSLIILPLEKQNYSNIHKSYKTFLNEWIKIEREITNEFYNIYILKELVDIARHVRPYYIKPETRNQSITIFRNSIYESLNKISKFCRPKDIHFEKLLCSMYVLAKNIEGILYEVISTRMEDKQKEYDKMLLQSTEQIFAVVNVNIKDDYIYNKNTTVLIIDNVNKKNAIYQVPENEIDNINNLNPLTRGMYISDLYDEKDKN